MRVEDDGTIVFLCHCGRPFAELSEKGMEITSRHGSARDDNLIPFAALEVLMRGVKGCGPKT
jgi:hypothetical protein